MNTPSTRDQFLAQVGAFRRMQGDELELINRYAADFRDIIEEFDVKFGRAPTADDLLWIESQHCGRDITLAA